MGYKLELNNQLKDFLISHGNGKDIEADFIPVDTDLSKFPPNFGIQQNLHEFLEFISYCLDEKKSGLFLEIGFGYHGTSHAILRNFFQTVISIDNQVERMRRFYFDAIEHFGENYFALRNSFFVGGDSNSADTLLKVIEILSHKNEETIKEIDVLFIDGSHIFESVLTDFLLYEHLLSIGGLVAFHDINNPMEDGGVLKFRNLLNKLDFMNNRYELCKEIVHSRFLGIAIYKRIA